MADDTPRRPRLVVVHHRPERTPETVALIELVRWLVAEGSRRVEVLLLAGGPLTHEFEAVAPTSVVADLDRASRDGRYERALFALRQRRRGFSLRARRLGLDQWGTGDAVYLHTVLGLQVLRYLPSAGPAVLCRLAEDVHPLRHPLTEADLTVLLAGVDRFLPVTSVGRDEMVDLHGLDAARVQKVPELFVPPDERLPDRSAERARLRGDLGIDPEALVVGSFGGAEADAPDLGVMLWSMLTKRVAGHGVELIWGIAQTEAGFWMDHDLRETGLAAGTHAIPTDVPMGAYLELCDLLVLLTRVDDYPFAYLERAAAGVPVLCFAGNGIADLAGLGDPRNVAPYLDMAAVADQVARLLESPGVLAERRDAMLAAVASVHGPEAAGRRLLDALADLAGRP